MPQMLLDQTGTGSPLLGLPEMHSKNGPPLSMGQQLRRGEQPKVLRSLHSIIFHFHCRLNCFEMCYFSFTSRPCRSTRSSSPSVTSCTVWALSGRRVPPFRPRPPSSCSCSSSSRDFSLLSSPPLCSVPRFLQSGTTRR